MSKTGKHFYDFGRFRIDPVNHLLLRDGEPLPVTPQDVDTLLALIHHPEEVVNAGATTDLLRKTLGKSADGRDYIHAVPGRGYRFVGRVYAIAEPAGKRRPVARWLASGAIATALALAVFAAISRQPQAAVRDASRRESTPANRHAIEYFERAVRYDPGYAPAWAGLADAYATLGSRYDNPEQSQDDAMAKAKAAALQALRFNPLLAEAHAALGVVKSRYDWDWPGAESEFKRAIQLDPNYAHARQGYSLFLSAVGRTSEAKAEMLRARELNPLSVAINRDLGDILMGTREYPQALEQFRRTLTIHPDDPMRSALRCTMGWAYELQGLHEQAVAEFLEALRLQGVKATLLSDLRQGYAVGGMTGYWRRWLAFQQHRIAAGRLDPFILAQVYAFLGEQDTSFVWLDKACEARSLVVPTLRFGPIFDRMRTAPRFAQLLRRIGLGT